MRLAGGVAGGGREVHPSSDDNAAIFHLHGTLQILTNEFSRPSDEAPGAGFWRHCGVGAGATLCSVPIRAQGRLLVCLGPRAPALCPLLSGGPREDTTPHPPLHGRLPESSTRVDPDFKKYTPCTFTHPGLPGGGPRSSVMLTQDVRSKSPTFPWPHLHSDLRQSSPTELSSSLTLEPPFDPCPQH